jgi:hypothetical protein
MNTETEVKQQPTAPMAGLKSPVDPSAEAHAREVYDSLATKMQEQESLKEAALAKTKEAATKKEQSSAQTRNEDGKFVKSKQAEEPKETTAKAEAAESSESDDDREPEVDGTDAKAQERALTALRRAKVPKDILEGLPDEVKLKWGRQLAKVQSETDRMAQEFAALKKGSSEKQVEPKQDNQRTDSERATKQAKAAEQPEQAYIRQAAKQLADTFMLGDEAEEAFASALQSATKPLSERYQQMEQQVQIAAGLSTQMLLANARTQLAADYPELREKETFGNVIATMQRMAESGAYADIDDLQERTESAMRDAAQVVLRDAIQNRVKAQRIQTDQKRNAGQASVPKRSGSTEINGMSRDRAIFHLMSSEGLNGAEARRRVDGY